MNQKTIIAILAAIAVILAGSTVYFAMQNREPAPAASPTPVVAPTNADAPTPADETPTPEVPEVIVAPTPETFTYRNERYGFELTFPAAWQEYTTTNRMLSWGRLGSSDSIDFSLPAQPDGLFNISVHTKQQWKDMQSIDGPTPAYLGENDTLVFGWAPSQYTANSTMALRWKEVPNIIKTFAFFE